MTIHISFDIETWGKRPGCDIRSIGAVVFDPVAGFVHDGSLGTFKPFYIATDNPLRTPFNESARDNRELCAGSMRKYFLTRDPDTVKWWNDQGEEAQAAFANPVDLREALDRFSSWIINMYPGGFNGELTDDIKIWANGPHFDVSIFAAVYHAVGLNEPWHYRASRDMRTITEAAGMTRDDYCNYGVPHHARDDAIAQAMTICEAHKRLGLRK